MQKGSGFSLQFLVPKLTKFMKNFPIAYCGVSTAIPIARKIRKKIENNLKTTFLLFRRNLNKLRKKVNLDSFGMTNFAEILKHQLLRQIMQQLCVNNFCANCRLFPMSAMSTIQNVSFNICFIRKCF